MAALNAGLEWTVNSTKNTRGRNSSTPFLCA